MAFVNKHGDSQITPGSSITGYRQSSIDFTRFIQIKNMIQQIGREVEALKGRLSRLEEMLLGDGKLQKESCTATNRPDCAQSPSPLPIADLKQLADMAKRFR